MIVKEKIAFFSLIISSSNSSQRGINSLMTQQQQVLGQALIVAFPERFVS